MSLVWQMYVTCRTSTKKEKAASDVEPSDVGLNCCCISFSLGLFTGRWCCHFPMYPLSSFHGPSALCRGREKRCCMPPPMYPFLFHGPSALRPARLLVLHATSMYHLSALCRGRDRKELLHATPNVPFPLSRAVGTSPRPFIGVACHSQCTTFPLFTDRRHFAAAVKRGVAPQTLNPEL